MMWGGALLAIAIVFECVEQAATRQDLRFREAEQDQMRSVGSQSGRSLDRLASHLDRCANGNLGGGTGDSTEPFDVADHGLGNSGSCVGVLYVWSSSMPLSRLGVENVEMATSELGVPLYVIDGRNIRTQFRAACADDTQRRVEPKVGRPHSDRIAMFTQRLISAGATLHYPAILVYHKWQIINTALLGYKADSTYHSALEAMLRSPNRPEGIPAAPWLCETDGNGHWTRPVGAVSKIDHVEVEGQLGAYFRAVPETATIAYEANGQNYLVSTISGRRWRAPGVTDLIPTPDGRYFVTPTPPDSGLRFFSAEDILDQRGDTGGEATAIYVDSSMKDQYPSVGIVEQKNGHRKYRVLTSWNSSAVFRDYIIRENPTEAGGSAKVIPLGSPVPLCPDRRLSLPIISPEGDEFAARDEEGASTKIFEIDRRGSCRETEDFGVQTGKVAFSSEGAAVAFAIPPGVVHDGRGIAWIADPNTARDAGVFVWNREYRVGTHIWTPDQPGELIFPDFVNDSTLIVREGQQFKILCCIQSGSVLTGTQ